MIRLSESPAVWAHCLAVVRPALMLAPRSYLQDVQDRLASDGIQAAVVRHDTQAVFDWIVRLLARQGISNAAAEAFAERAGSPRWADVSERLARSARCPRLRNYWASAAGSGFAQVSQPVTDFPSPASPVPFPVEKIDYKLNP